MMKRTLGKIVALTTVLTMTVGSSVFAATGTINGSGTAGSQNIDATTEVDNPTYNVTVPTTLDFTIDAYETESKGEVFSGDINITNASDVDVKVDVKITPTLDTGVQLVGKDEVNRTDVTDTDNDIYLAIQVADTTADGSKALVLVPETEKAIAASGTTVSFKMGKGKSTPTYVGLAVTGRANPLAAWDDTLSSESVKINVAFTITGLTTAMSSAITTVTGTCGLIQEGPVATVTKDVTETQNGIITLANVPNGVTVSSIVAKNVPVGAENKDVTIRETETYSISGNVITILCTAAQSTYMMGNNNNSSGDYLLVITLSDNTVLNVTVNYDPATT